MPFAYHVAANGRTGPELRLARQHHQLVATGPSARLGLLLPHITTTTIVGPNGAPLEVRLPFLLALWLVLGCLTISDAVGPLFVYEYIVGAERLGAACDALLASCDLASAVTPSFLRRRLLVLAVQLRANNPLPFVVTPACLLVVGGAADNTEAGNLAFPLAIPPLSPHWFTMVTFLMLLCPDLTLVVLSELEAVWAPRWLATQRTAGGGFAVYHSLLLSTLSAGELTIISALSAPGQAEQFAALTVTLLPSAPEMVGYPPSPAAAALNLSRACARAASAGGALLVGVHEALVVIPHYEPFELAIGTGLGAPAALGLLLEAVRAALKSATAQLTLGNIAAAAELYKYLVGRLRVMRAASAPSSECVTFLLGELADRREHESSSRGSSSASAAAAGGASAGTSAVGGMGYAQMYISALCNIMADPSFIKLNLAEIMLNLDSHLPPGVSIETKRKVSLFDDVVTSKREYKQRYPSFCALSSPTMTPCVVVAGFL